MNDNCQLCQFDLPTLSARAGIIYPFQLYFIIQNVIDILQFE